MKLVILEKARRIYVPPGKRKGYWREDPREKRGILSILKNILDKIIGTKRKGLFTKEQKKYVRKKLKELEPKMKYFESQKKRLAVSRALKEIRSELKEKSEPKIRSKDGKTISDEHKEGLKRLGYTIGDIKRLSLHSIKAIYYNDIKKEE